MQNANYAQSILEAINHITTKHPELLQSLESMILQKLAVPVQDINFLLGTFQPLLQQSKSQIRQDLFVLIASHFKRNGFFVEFGATDGVSLSNTYILENNYAWTGILAEPARIWHDRLKTNRSAAIETSCIWRKTGEILHFNEVSAPELSTINEFSGSDMHREARTNGEHYSVETITLLDLLKKHNAPRQIDYLSIDTEGSEFDILEAFDFDQFDIRIITCEHNYTNQRQRIHDLLTRNGYARVLPNISQFDDWYVKTDLAASFGWLA